MNYEKIGIVIRNGVATYLASEMIADKNKALTMTDKQREEKIAQIKSMVISAIFNSIAAEKYIQSINKKDEYEKVCKKIRKAIGKLK